MPWSAHGFKMVLILPGISVGLFLLLHEVLGNYGIRTRSTGTKTIESLLTEFKNETHDLGSSVHLTCTNKTWNELIYIIWKLKTAKRHCKIASGFDMEDYDSCNDGKVMNITKTGRSYLRIPLFSTGDEGLYHCEAVHRDGTYLAEIKVSTRVPVSPQISIRLDFKDGKRVAVCSAKDAKPAAHISWGNIGNLSETQNSTNNSDGSFTVESRLILPDSILAVNLSCTVTHPRWREGRTQWIQALNNGESTDNFALQYSVLSVCSVILLLGILAACFILRTSVRKRKKIWIPLNVANVCK
ncbi:hypothetical protein GJAV_G00253640 [Gymnothorax javanicus]|nr:hypothetical protein GJAV_G00253640 [Gymnothorax javanicus]